MALTNAEKQARFRAKRGQDLADAKAEIERLTELLKDSRQRVGQYAEESRQDLERAFDMSEKLENLRKYNKGLNTRNRRLTIWLEYYDITIGEDGEVETKAGLSAAHWDRLRAMDDGQLRQWVMAGQAMELKGHDSPVENSIAWVEGNRLTPA